ncbi:MAG: hypothetical protein RBT69_07275 [Spirochaetia bacterium]|jgi:archaellum biogenesis ATPase FlaH|nr:hypothetical protein [Spirochaetia bacterium]
MVKSELIQRSPLRILEKSINGGLGKGNIAFVASKKGVGKTACLVHIATDKLIRERNVIHVSFAKRTDHIIRWYEDIFNEIAKKRNLENPLAIHDEIIRNRVIMNFNQRNIDISQILKSLDAMIVGGNFKADAVIIDGFEIEQMSLEGLKKIKEFAQKLNLEVWVSASLKKNDLTFDENGLPYELADLLDAIDVLITLKYDEQNIRMDIAKDRDDGAFHDRHLFLDPKTLLIIDSEF